MNVILTLEDGTEKRWTGFKPDRIMSTEAEAIEKVTGMTFGQWGQALMNGSSLASRALVWVLRKREEPTLRFRDVDFAVGDLMVGLDEEERTKVLAAMETDPTLTEEDRAQAMAAITASAEADGGVLDPDGPGNSTDPTESETG